jgi:hypothetical protein
MPQDDTLQDIIERIAAARDRAQNASDEQGVRDADQALGDLHGLDSSALPTARDIEEYFNQRGSMRLKKRAASTSDSYDSSDNS